MEHIVNNSRCVDSPDCDGLWVQLVFAPSSYRWSDNTPDSYMVQHANVYQIQGDWAVCLSGADATAVARHELEWSVNVYDSSVCRWLNVNDQTLQETFCPHPKKVNPEKQGMVSGYSIDVDGESGVLPPWDDE